MIVQPQTVPVWWVNVWQTLAKRQKLQWTPIHLNINWMRWAFVFQIWNKKKTQWNCLLPSKNKFWINELEIPFVDIFVVFVIIIHKRLFQLTLLFFFFASCPFFFLFHNFTEFIFAKSQCYWFVAGIKRKRLIYSISICIPLNWCIKFFVRRFCFISLFLFSFSFYFFFFRFSLAELAFISPARYRENWLQWNMKNR